MKSTISFQIYSCANCDTIASNPYKTPCNKTLCDKCVLAIDKNSPRYNCPYCFIEHDLLEILPNELKRTKLKSLQNNNKKSPSKAIIQFPSIKVDKIEDIQGDNTSILQKRKKRTYNEMNQYENYKSIMNELRYDDPNYHFNLLIEQMMNNSSNNIPMIRNENSIKENNVHLSYHKKKFKY